jgi:hypothetical protein
MRELRSEAWGVLLAFAITLAFNFWPTNPYLMGAFTFVAQPLFVLAAASYLWKVLRGFRKQRIL